jgi:dimethylaniline monooxygenase (N-oxide forming)
MDSFIKNLMNKLYDLKPEWRFEPAPSVLASRPIVNDELINCLTDGTVISINGLSKVIDDYTVELEDGTQLKVDSIIFATGYTLNYSIVGDSDPTRKSTRQWANLPGSNNRQLPRLYQNIFSVEHPESLAFMGSLSFMNPAFLMFDLASMALTQLWKGNSQFPPRAEMEQAVDRHHEWMCSLAAKGSVSPGAVKGVDFSEWVDEVAGIGLREKLGYGFQGWWFWLKDREFCNVLMDGLLSPHVYRVFSGNKRQHWEGARDELLKINKELKAKNWEP